MKNIKKYKIITTTINSQEAIDSIKNTLLLKKKSPCIQVIKSLQSSYKWKGDVVTEDEMMLIIKTNKTNCSSVITEIKKHHTYDTPEIISYDFDILSDKYKEWFEHNIEG